MNRDTYKYDISFKYNYFFRFIIVERPSDTCLFVEDISKAKAVLLSNQ